ncbi:MAG: type IV toxin-antitoxin system AbiEi family antitoxin domain-containing protein, partial [Actinomycetota bacterium]|nr:type IV toxin-antitoxin system AbiEi family antitoxin domain-containing protein [Actinomycetota bacterium]
MDRAQRMLVERRCSLLAARQYGVITRGQLLEAGLTPRQAERMVSSSRWRSVLPGTYALATASTSLQQRVMAAVRWAGPSAAASFETA